MTISMSISSELSSSGDIESDSYDQISYIGIVGMGVVGTAMYESFKKNDVPVLYYEKYSKSRWSTSTPLEVCIKKCHILFLALPTQLSRNDSNSVYNLKEIEETLQILERERFSGIVVLKSTVIPGTTVALSRKFLSLSIFHCPEFLTERTAIEDFHTQKEIIVGTTFSCTRTQIEDLTVFFKSTFPHAGISICTSTESECTKIFCNAFYGAKVQIMNEFYFFTEKLNGAKFKVVIENMLKQGWINEKHTNVPGHDGLFSFGGHCLPKDTNALLRSMQLMNTPSKVIDAVAEEQKEMRNLEEKRNEK